MAMRQFNPVDNARPPREQGWEQETEKIIQHIKNRGDQRIGQLLINVVGQDIEPPEFTEPEKEASEMTEKELQKHTNEIKNKRAKYKADIEQKLWSIEADELLQKLEQHRENTSK